VKGDENIRLAIRDWLAREVPRIQNTHYTSCAKLIIIEVIIVNI
jgi:hypothetical protein